MSAYLFTLAIEVLLIRVRESELVRGIPVIDKEIKLDAYADVGRFFLKDLQSLYTILDIMEEFGSSLKLNLQKSEACWIGASRFNANTSTNWIWVNLVNDIIRVLGTSISYNKQLADQYNFVNVATDTKNILSNWKLRGLSLAGRIQVFKALALSKAMFICTMKPYSKKFLDDLNEIQKDFIWRGRKTKINHTSPIGDYSEGGMKDIGIKAKLESLRIQWVKRLTNNNFHSWKIIPNVLLEDVGGVSLFHSNLALSDACKLQIDNYPEFYKSVVHLWIKISATDPQSEHDILLQTLWNNKYILIKRKPIFFLEFYQKGINTINDLIDDERGFYTWNRIKEKYELDKGLYTKYAGLLKALPANWRKFLKECRTASIANLSFSTNVRLRQNSVQLDNLVPKIVYEILIQPIKKIQLLKEPWKHYCKNQALNGA